MNKVANFLLQLKKIPKKSSLENFNYDKTRSILIFTNENLPIKKDPFLSNATILFNSDTNDLPNNYSILIDKADFSYLGKVKSGNIKEILEKNYDLFIDINTENSAFIKYIYEIINADFKVSFRQADWVDFQISNENKSATEYMEYVKQILSNFN